MQYTAQFNQGGFVNALFGQSYSCSGRIRSRMGGATNTGLDSGLDTTRSDYVARVSYQPNSTYTVHLALPLRQRHLRRPAHRTRGARQFRPLVGVSAALWRLCRPARIGFLDRRQGILGTGSVKLDANWVLLGAARYDINAGKFDQTRIGLGYVDDCLILALNYITNYTYSGNAGAPTTRSCCN